jgi:iron complex outermembrane receptor protein
MKRKTFTFLFILLGFFVPVSAQVDVSGKVTNESNKTLIGVSVLEKGTTNGTVTDADGHFKIQTAGNSASLIFSYTGYETKEVALNGQTDLSVSLKEDVELEVIQVVGSRSFKRTVTDSPVPIDVINVAEIAASNGRVDMNQIIQYVASSFNATKQSGSDGADHIDPASLRGMGPDQTLVLINGKRMHQSSLVNVFGTRGRGNTGTDLNAIPVASIKKIEILRDGASAQYGSDAIAGVINILLNDQTDGIIANVTYGMFSTKAGGDYAQQIFDTQGGWEPVLFNIDGTNRIDGKDKKFDGNTAKIDLNYGIKIGDKGGFINFTSEFLTKEHTFRPSFDWREGYGSAAIDQFQFIVNSAIPVSKNTDIYFFGGSGDRGTDAYAYTRGAPGIDGDDRTVASLYPNGFNPRITSKILDNTITVGIRHKMSNGWNTDFSNSYGSNNFHYFIKETNNASMGNTSPINFDAGGHSLSMNLTSFDMTKYYDNFASGFNLAFGAEFRRENFQIFSGEEASYAAYDINGVAITDPSLQSPYINEFGQQAPGGSQGFPGYSSENVVNEFRTNASIYVDAELNITKKFLVSGALRFEKYSDFGNSFNYKIASRYEILKGFSARVSYSTGFRAPSLAQIHYNLLFNNIVAGASLRTLLASNTSTVAKAFGIKPLTQETAENLAAGLTLKRGSFTASVDGYMINVKNRIILTDIFDASSLGVGAEAAQFFANGVNTQTTGIDVVLNYNIPLGGSSTNSIYTNFAGNVNKTKIIDINSGGLNEFTFFGPFSRAYLEAAAPPFKLTLNVGFKTAKLDVSFAYTEFSEVKLQDFQWIDTPATNQAEADALYAIATDVYKANGTLDFSISYKLMKNLRITAGSYNLLNVRPTPQFDGWTDQGGFNDSVQMGSDGAYYFIRLGFNF